MEKAQAAGNEARETVHHPKTCSSMFKEGNYYRMNRPTEQDLYQDAKRILDELLEKQLDDRRNALGKRRHNITDPFPYVRRPRNAGDVLDERAEQGLDGINCSQTVPTRPRPSLSSAFSKALDGESSLVSDNRKKKSLFRWAKSSKKMSPKGHKLNSIRKFFSGGKKHRPTILAGESDSPDGKGKPEGMDSFMDNVPLHEQKHHEEKEEMYGKIAHKLNRMGDSCAAERGMSESKSRRDRGSQAASHLQTNRESDSVDGKGKPEEMDSLMDKVPLHERTHEEKEEMYGEIAHKLIGMADSYAAERGMSESESCWDRGSQAASHLQTDRGDDGLTDLVDEIVACLKEIVDRNPVIGPQKNTLAEVYERFKKTVQHWLGNEVSWNHLAFLFYTTKGVVFALGSGTKAAASAKEMTLRYVTDWCAKWIMDQGGFDSVLSDSNLD